MQEIYPQVSVIVPIYNVELFLQKCIDSICKQTYKCLEIILVDDGSTDGCGRICDENVQRDSRIVVIHKENGGLSSARNAGLDIAKGEYISFIDADDTIHPMFIEILINLCIQFQGDIAQCDFLTVADTFSGIPINPLQSICVYNNLQAVHKMCCTNNAMQFTIACNKVYKRDLFCKIRYPLDKLHEDEFITYLLLWNARKIIVINQYMYYYLQRKTSIMGRKFSIKRLDALEAFKQRLDFLKDRQLWEEWEATLKTLIYLFKEYYFLLAEGKEDSSDICAKLRKEKYIAESMLEKYVLVKNKIPEKCCFLKDSKIALYGAGHLGRIYYQWFKENQWGEIVGWVDNAWSRIKGTEYPITPVDSLRELEADYIVVAIQDRIVQEEVVENLICWGIPKTKIITKISLGKKDIDFGEWDKFE